MTEVQMHTTAVSPFYDRHCPTCMARQYRADFIEFVTEMRDTMPLVYVKASTIIALEERDGDELLQKSEVIEYTWDHEAQITVNEAIEHQAHWMREIEEHWQVISFDLLQSIRDNQKYQDQLRQWWGRENDYSDLLEYIVKWWRGDMCHAMEQVVMYHRSSAVYGIETKTATGEKP